MSLHKDDTFQQLKIMMHFLYFDNSLQVSLVSEEKKEQDNRNTLLELVYRKGGKYI